MTRTWDQLEQSQPIVLKMLRNSLKKNRLAHAYLFEGMKGTGKKDISILLAKSVLCENLLDKYVPCETCSNCKRITHGNHPDVHILEPDGLSIKKHQIQSLQEEFSKMGVESKKKLYIISHADKMTTNAANSLLKFLEEPNAETMAILLTEQIQQIIPTILSRCQILSFTPLTPSKLVDQLIINGIKNNDAPKLAQLTNNYEEALLLSSDEWFVQAQKIVVKLYETLKGNSLEALVALQRDWFLHFKEKDQYDKGLDLLLLLYKDLLYIQLGKHDKIVHINEKELLEASALKLSNQSLTEQISAIFEAKRKLQGNMNPQLLMEQLVLKLQEGSSVV
ncbi:DNA polymerase III subunit delta' [Niallia sp. 01092]|uniref:DNA polymerase III subunit delta' n=1 Tax=unclassified Niallia TaxID=2837522 RepID=UPI003FD34EEB